MVAQTRLHSLLVTQWRGDQVWAMMRVRVCPPEPGPPGSHTYLLRLTYPSVPDCSVRLRNLILNRNSLGRGKPGEFSMVHLSLALDNIRPLPQEASIFLFVKLWEGGSLGPCWPAY